MGLVTTEKMFDRAANGGYAIGAFNFNNMEVIQAIINAAANTNSPVILQASTSAIKYMGFEYINKMVEAAIETSKKAGKEVEIALHLDHGDSFETCKECIDNGFTSVMIDGSKYSFEENVELTKKVVEYAHKRGVVVEAEIGKLAGVEDDVNVDDEDAKYTNPDEAVEFVERTGCDSLAIAIGTSHGAYKFKGEPKLRFDILEEITARLPKYPIVLHGASSVPQDLVEKCNKYGGNIPGAKGVPEDMLRKAASLGVCKINVDSDLRIAMTAMVRECFETSPEVFDPRKYLGKAREEIQSMIERKIVNAFGSNGKAEV